MFERLLVAIDDSDCAEMVLDFATALARRESGAIHVVHVNQFLVGGRGFTELTEREAARLVKGTLRQLRQDVGDLRIEVSASLVRASCFQLPEAVVTVAQRQRSDAIVVGSRRRRGARRLFGHGIRERITSLSPLPVLVAPAPLEVPGRRSFLRHPSPSRHPAGTSVTA